MFKVVIDLGHGGRDPGAIGQSGVQEKDVTLAVALKVKSILKPVAGVILTREGDDDIDLAPRADVANKAGADCFVSIHCNSAANPKAQGTETYFYPGSEEGKKLAALLQKNLVAALRLADRGVKQANFAVLRLTECPAALAEIAFISNMQEESLLASEDFQQHAAQAIAAGIAEYLGIALPEGGNQTMPEQWKFDIIEKAKQAGLITQDHDPDETAPKWFVLAVALNLLKVVKGQ
ncbi:MAG: N-acetylmuramoyl-L-alanine amidase [Peptococcaceae bacterium]|nr:N-acetylmuramoyl-L-alanine amidase [Peptococcaceae bacterium]